MGSQARGRTWFGSITARLSTISGRWILVLNSVLESEKLGLMRGVMSGSQSATFRVVPSTPADLDRVLAIEEQSFSAPWSRKMFEAELTGNPFGHLWGAWVRDARNNEHQVCARRRDGEPAGGLSETLIGYICFWVVFDEFRLMTLAIESAWRRRGIARGLMCEALTWASTAGARRALLEVRASNHAAIQLYEQAGFRSIAVREQYYTNPIENALIMAMEPIR
jgi:ribosomal-protein-alanine N-acetyltransferase